MEQLEAQDDAECGLQEERATAERWPADYPADGDGLLVDDGAGGGLHSNDGCRGAGGTVLESVPMDAGAVGGEVDLRMESKPVPALEVAPFQPPSSTGRPVLGIPRKWKETQRDKPPCPVGYELNPKGERIIGKKKWVGYQLLRVDGCSECGKRARRPVVGFVSPTAVWRLLQRDQETQKRLIQIKLIGGNKRKPVSINLRCAGCAAGTGSGTLRSIGE